MVTDAGSRWYYYGVKLFRRTRRSYQTYADVYDALKGDRSETIGLLGFLIEKYHPGAARLLDLACGTGAIAEGLDKRFTVVGLDKSRRMLRQAKQKLPAMQLVLGDMAKFSLPQTFDAVYCLHNSVNHLLTFREWEQMFANVAKHLRPNGIFIFDINTDERMERLTTLGTSAVRAGKDYVVTWVTKDPRRRERYNWETKLFLERRPGYFVMHDETILVSAYPLGIVKQAVSETFDILECFTLEYVEKPDEIGRTYFVCRKKS